MFLALTVWFQVAEFVLPAVLSSDAGSFFQFFFPGILV